MEYEIEITGMHCEGCADSLERYLRAEPGVTAATVSYDERRGTVTTDGETDVTELLEAIEVMGYGADLDRA